MSESPLSGVEPMVLESRISVPYKWWAGETASRFFVALRDEKKILGRRCGRCQRVYVPPRKACPGCFCHTEAWVPLPDVGTLQSYTVARRQLQALRKQVPVVFGLIRLDGADTSLLHHVDVDPDLLKVGLRVEAVYADERTGSIMDIACFRPAR